MMCGQEVSRKHEKLVSAVRKMEGSIESLGFLCDELYGTTKELEPIEQNAELSSLVQVLDMEPNIISTLSNRLEEITKRLKSGLFGSEI